MKILKIARIVYSGVIISEVDGEEYEDLTFRTGGGRSHIPIFLNRVDEIEFDE